MRNILRRLCSTLDPSKYRASESIRQYTLPNGDRQINFTYKKEKKSVNFSLNDSVENIAKKISVQTGEYEVIFYNQDGIQIAKKIPFGPLTNEPLSIKIGKNHMFSLSEDVDCKKKHLSFISPYFGVEEFENLRLPMLYQKSVLAILSKLNPQSELAKKYGIITELQESCMNPQFSDVRSINSIEKEFQELLKEFNEFKSKEKIIKQDAKRYAKRLFGLGVIIFGSYIAFIITTIFIMYSWDVMEPIIYFIEFGVGLLAFTLFFRLRGAYKHQRLLKTVQDWMQKHIEKKRGFNRQQFEQVRNRIIRNREERIKNIMNEF